MWEFFGQIFLILIPVMAYLFAKKYRPESAFSIIGISFGLIAAPFSFGLYGFYWISGFSIILFPLMFVGLGGLLLTSFHGSPGFDIATHLGYRMPRTVVDSYEAVIITIINGVFWAVVYGFLGFLIDKFRNRKLNKELK